MSQESPNPGPGGAKTAGAAVVGLILMVGGFYASNGLHAEPSMFPQLKTALDTLESQGIPFDPFKTVSVIGTFLLLFPVINSFFIKPLGDAIHSRTSELENTFSEAEGLRTEMTKMRADYEAQLAKTEAEAREKIQAQIKEAQDLRHSLIAEANAAKDQMVAKAQEEIQREKDRVMNEVRLEVVNLTLAATSKIVGENVTDDRNRKLVQEFIEKAEVPVH